jgi:hypothetical protein
MWERSGHTVYDVTTLAMGDGRSASADLLDPSTPLLFNDGGEVLTGLRPHGVRVRLASLQFALDGSIDRQRGFGRVGLWKGRTL